MPEVQAAMVKEIRNLQENGTYQEVPQEPWMVVVPSMWVIQRSAEDDGKQTGNLKACLVYEETKTMLRTTFPVTILQ